MAGTLFLIVGPSGAGKDTLIDGARAKLAGDGRTLFARRVITRPAGSGGEDHEPATEAEFGERERGGGFLITWRAHGLAYGLPAQLGDALAAGRNVVANVSRAVLDELVRRFPTAHIVEITAPPEILATRLAGRGRETASQIAERLARDGAAMPVGATVTTVVNDSAPEDGIARLLAVLEKTPC